MKKRTWIVIVAVCVFSLVTWLANGHHGAEAAGDASFATSPASGSYTVGNTINVNVAETSSAGDNVNAVQVNLSYPSTLTWQSTNLTGSFTLCAQNSHTATSVSLACASATAVSGTQAIATIAFSVAASGSAAVDMVSGSDIDNTSGQSVWNGTLPSATYSLASTNGPAPTPTPTPTPVPTHQAVHTTKSPSPTPTPSAKPTPSPSVSASPTPSPSASPQPKGSVSITISDSTGRVAGATVSLNGQTYQTSASGVVNFAGVPNGTYQVVITSPGDQSRTATVTLSSGQNALLSYTLVKAASSSTNWMMWLLVALGVLVAGSAVVFARVYVYRTPPPVPVSPTAVVMPQAAAVPTPLATPSVPPPAAPPPQSGVNMDLSPKPKPPAPPPTQIPPT